MEITGRNTRLALACVWWGSILLLLSRAWQYLYWDSPLRVLVWDEDAFSGVVGRWGWTWSEWVTSEKASIWIENWTIGLGIVLLLSALAFIVWKKKGWNGLTIVLLSLGVGVLLLHAVLNTKANYWRLGHFAELTLQWSTPLLFWLMSRTKVNYQFIDYCLRVAIALTFVGHGLYAYGYYPVPGHFQQMMISGFGLSNEGALMLLKLAGILDFLAAGLLFIPQRQIRYIALWYIIIWGFLTALARIWSHAGFTSLEYLFTHWIPEFSVRSEHFLVPFGLFWWWKETNKR